LAWAQLEPLLHRPLYQNGEGHSTICRLAVAVRSKIQIYRALGVLTRQMAYSAPRIWQLLKLAIVEFF